jgi:histidinol dehydrogenase
MTNVALDENHPLILEAEREWQKKRVKTKMNNITSVDEERESTIEEDDHARHLAYILNNTAPEHLERALDDARHQEKIRTARGKYNVKKKEWV